MYIHPRSHTGFELQQKNNPSIGCIIPKNTLHTCLEKCKIRWSTNTKVKRIYHHTFWLDDLYECCDFQISFVCNILDFERSMRNAQKIMELIQWRHHKKNDVIPVEGYKCDLVLQITACEEFSNTTFIELWY